MTLHQNSPLIKQYLSALELFNPETTPAKAREGRRERAWGSQGGCTTARSKMLRAEETGYNSLRSDKHHLFSNAFTCEPRGTRSLYPGTAF